MRHKITVSLIFVLVSMSIAGCPEPIFPTPVPIAQTVSTSPPVTVPATPTTTNTPTSEPTSTAANTPVPSTPTSAACVPITPKVSDSLVEIPSNTFDIKSSNHFTATTTIDKATDSCLNTWWKSEGDQGKGSLLSVVFNQPQTISRIGIYRVGITDPVIYHQVREMLLQFADGSEQKVTFKPLAPRGEWDFVDIQPVNTDSLAITVTGIITEPSRYLQIVDLAFFSPAATSTLMPSTPTSTACVQITRPVSEALVKISPASIKPNLPPIPSNDIQADGSYSITTHIADYAIDNCQNTFWLGGKEQSSLYVVFPQRQKISSIGIYHDSSTPNYLEAKTILLTFTDNSTQTITYVIKPSWEFQPIQPIETDSINLSIMESFPKNPNAPFVKIAKLAFFGPAATSTTVPTP